MQRIPSLSIETAPEGSKPLLEAVKKQLGMVPNLFGVFAQSPAVLNAYLSLSGALGAAKISAQLREQVALVVASANACDYCASAHTLLGKGAGVAADELAANLAGQSSDAKVQAALDFASAIVNSRGHVADADLAAVRAAGYGDDEVVELVAVTMVNILTNYFNHVAATVVDFPLVSTAKA
ncbi:carboxymuconolactone decarboxylase family protein [Hankyongella ginsenosidimutans]|uniref:Carboxymuconolactone decarboxylase family protein n=1 Tax=Hankyongella ginsenosidimutans TaxID=1763828 RepID=A0A4D7CB70_9SPHN|nr:carboxymuconolactone decarboxylase family protein [Hankyongella ginsenosidimutans]QCI79056.1 carboxymuconolactone decarboxylase family protein [Hankyongella ginsenosidimutans]TXG82611.1 MAG: carboxymuconolactone decarboxylase family protein [Sphingomonadales bacterium]